MKADPLSDPTSRCGPNSRPGLTVPSCPRCSARMEYRHSSWQCPRCRYKEGCCEGVPQS